mgnify:CR=1 FL=1
MALPTKEELGFDLFLRHGKRIRGFTHAGKTVLSFAQEILNNSP